MANGTSAERGAAKPIGAGKVVKGGDGDYRIW
jgi:hypothetical protein